MVITLRRPGQPDEHVRVRWELGFALLPSLRMSFRSLFLRTVLPGLFVLCGLQAMAQETKPRVVLYKERMAAQFDTVDCVKNIFKINPLLFFRGEIPLYYERALTPSLSLELGFGVTLRDYLTLSFNGDDADDYGAGTDIIPNLSFHIAARFYFDYTLEPEGMYLQTEFAHLTYSKDIHEKDPGGAISDRTNLDERTYNDLRVLLGYQMLSSSSNWLVDIYGGLGVRSRHQIIVNEDHIISSDPDVPDTYEYTVEESDDTVPAVFLGVKIGLGF